MAIHLLDIAPPYWDELGYAVLIIVLVAIAIAAIWAFIRALPFLLLGGLVWLAITVIATPLVAFLQHGTVARWALEWAFPYVAIPVGFIVGVLTIWMMAESGI